MAVIAANGQDEREAELLVVGGVERLQPFELLGRALVEPRAGLLARGLCRQLAAHRSLAGQLRVGAHQLQLGGLAGGIDGTTQRGGQCCGVGERARLGGGLGEPGRMLVDAA
ncbi:hypothetical protein D3C86_1628060 [compost metagenome]